MTDQFGFSSPLCADQGRSGRLKHSPMLKHDIREDKTPRGIVSKSRTWYERKI